MLKFYAFFTLLLAVSIVATGDAHENGDYSQYVFPVDTLGATFVIDEITDKLLLALSGKNCTKPGYMCEDCKTVSFCIEVGNQWIKEQADFCNVNQTCFESSGQCGEGHNPYCDTETPPEYAFSCHQAGIFPDPFDCKKYHICKLDNGIPISKSTSYRCEGDFYYNSRTASCDRRILDDTCTFLGNPCDNSTQLGPILGNPSLYYACLRNSPTSKYFPQVFLCRNTQVFNAAISACEEQVPMYPINENGLCIVTGNYYHAPNCLQYNGCDTVGTAPILRTCATKTRFQPFTRSCIDFTCEDLGQYSEIYD